MRIPSAKVDQSIYFIGVDATDLKTRETALSSFTVYRSRNGAAEVAYTTPTVTEIDAANMPGVYALLVDEDTTVASGSDSEEYCVHITHAGMAPVTRVIELYRRSVTSGQTVDVANGGVEVATFQAGAITAAAIATDAIDADALAADAVAELQSGLATAAALNTVDDLLDTEIAAIKTVVDAIEVDTQDIQGRLPAALVSGRIDASVGAMAANVMTAAAAAADLTTELQTGLATAASIAALNNLSAAQINAEVDTALADYDGPTHAELTAGLDTALVDVGLTTVVTGRIDAAISSRLATAGYTAPDNAGIADLPTNAELATALAAADDAILAAIAALNNLSIANVRTAVGLASANLDTQLDALPTNAELATALAAADDAVLAAIAALTVPSANANADALLDRADAIEVGLTLRQAIRLTAAADGGKLSGAATATNTIRNAVADSKNRIVATVDSDGNRTAVTYDLA